MCSGVKIGECAFRCTMVDFKGHSSHKWNDRADALADEGRLGTLRTAEAEPECVD